jgi:hypothetical protein
VTQTNLDDCDGFLETVTEVAVVNQQSYTAAPCIISLNSADTIYSCAYTFENLIVTELTPSEIIKVVSIPFKKKASES